MKPSVSMLLTAALVANKVHGYVSINYDACYNINGPIISKEFASYPQAMDDSPLNDEAGDWCSFPEDLTELPWDCSVQGYSATIESNTGGCNNQQALGEGSIKLPTGEVIDPKSDDRCESICKEDGNCTFQKWRCDV